jgi:Ran GTPase-activating protein (RanGAP) involved in mRNA processing and transport
MRSRSSDRRLRNNKIGNQGAIAIAEALKVNGALTFLWLEGNSIGNQGGAAIGEALKFNGALTKLR